jgi:dTDP-4-amino-4,6-dideoxygalactose transaminase
VTTPIGVFGSRAGEEELEALRGSVLDGWMGMGPRVREFEARFAERLGVGFAMADSGSNALHLAMTALGLPPASDVVVPTFTWVACANAVALAGHTPVFADVELETASLSAETLAAALTERTAAVMVVHYAGRPVDVAAFDAFDLPVVEDAAHAVDSTRGGRACGTIGAAGVFSFDGVKNLATPDGGGVASADEEVLDRIRRLRYCGVGGSGFERSARGGRWWEHDDVEVFPRAIPNDVSASIAIAQLDRLAQNQARRREIWQTYQEAFAGLEWLALPPEAADGDRHSYFTYLVRVLDGRRDRLATELLARGIYTTLRYQPLHLFFPGGASRRLRHAEQLNEQGLNLPLHPRLTDADVERIVEAVRSFS